MATIMLLRDGSHYQCNPSTQYMMTPPPDHLIYLRSSQTAFCPHIVRSVTSRRLVPSVLNYELPQISQKAYVLVLGFSYCTRTSIT